MDGIPEKQIKVSLQYVEKKVIVSFDWWKAASNRGKQFHFLLDSNAIWAKLSFCRQSSLKRKKRVLFRTQL